MASTAEALAGSQIPASDRWRLYSMSVDFTILDE
jgi:hypothetical protein